MWRFSHRDLTQEVLINILFFFNKYSFLKIFIYSGNRSYLQHVARPGIEPRPLALETRHLSHWTSREVPVSALEVLLLTMIVLRKSMCAVELWATLVICFYF